MTMMELLTMYTSDDDIKGQFETLVRSGKYLRVESIVHTARFVEARAIIAAREIIERRDREIAALRQEIAFLREQGT